MVKSSSRAIQHIIDSILYNKLPSNIKKRCAKYCYWTWTTFFRRQNFKYFFIFLSERSISCGTCFTLRARPLLNLTCCLPATVKSILWPYFTLIQSAQEQKTKKPGFRSEIKDSDYTHGTPHIHLRVVYRADDGTGFTLRE